MVPFKAAPRAPHRPAGLLSVVCRSAVGSPSWSQPEPEHVVTRSIDKSICGGLKSGDGLGGRGGHLLHRLVLKRQKVPRKVKCSFRCPSLHMIHLHAEIFRTLDAASTDAPLIWKINSQQQIVRLFPHERTMSLLETDIQETLKLNEGERGRNPSGYEGKSLACPPLPCQDAVTDSGSALHHFVPFKNPK